MTSVDRKLLTREILLGFWKVHILHHAAEHPVIGQWVLGELRRHGYDISPGTLYPLLKRMERNGWLRCEVEPGGGPRSRRHYNLTEQGVAVLALLRESVVELHHEIIEEAAEIPHAAPPEPAPPAGCRVRRTPAKARRKQRPVKKTKRPQR